MASLGLLHHQLTKRKLRPDLLMVLKKIQAWKMDCYHVTDPIRSVAGKELGKQSLLHDRGRGVDPRLPSNLSHLCCAQRFGLMAPWMWTVLLRFLSALVSNWVEPRKPRQDIGWGEKRYFFTLSVSLRVPGNSCALYDELLPNASPLGSGNTISCPCLSNPTGGDGFPPSLVPRCINNHRWSPQLCPRLCKSFLQHSLFVETTQVNSASWRDLAG